MKTNQDRPETNRKPDRSAAAPRKRFRVVKLEERIAPTRGGKGSHNCSLISSA